MGWKNIYIFQKINPKGPSLGFFHKAISRRMRTIPSTALFNPRVSQPFVNRHTRTQSVSASLFLSWNKSDLRQFSSVWRSLLGPDFSTRLVLGLFLFRTLTRETFSPPRCHLTMPLREWQRSSRTPHSLALLSADLPSGPAELKVWQRPLCSSSQGQFLGLGWS